MTTTTTSRRDGVNSGAAIKVACKYTTTGNITLSGLSTQANGDWPSTLTAEDRIFVKAQTDATANGIYEASTGTWARAKDFDNNRDIAEGTLISVNRGSTLNDTMWRITNTGSIVIGTTSLTFERAGVSDSASMNFTAAGTGATARTVQAKLRDVINVKDYGATGDGSTDDTTACNYALDQGGTVVFSDGTFIVSASLTPPSGTEIIIAPDATIKGAASVAWGDTGLIDLSGGITDVAIHGGGTLDGNEPNNNTGRAYGVRIINNCQRIRVTGLRIKNMPSTGAGVNGGDGIIVQRGTTSCSDIWIHDNIITDCDRNGIAVTSGSRIHIKDNVVNTTAFFHGIDMEPDSGSDSLADIVITGNTVNAAKRSGIALALSNTSALSNITVTGNTVRDSSDATHGHGISLNSVTAFTGLLVANNNVLDVAVDGITFTNTGCEGVVISGNYVKSPGSVCIQVDNSNKVSVTGNVCDADAGTAIEFNGSDGVQITGNTIRVNGNFNGVNGFNASDSVVSGNHIQQVGSAQNNGVRFNTGSAESDNVVTGNRIRGFAAGVRIDTGETGCMIVGNDLLNNTAAITNSGTSTFIRHNRGWVTEAGGTGSIASGATTATITHGLSSTPAAANISIVFTEQGSNDYGRWWVSGITSTQFVVNVSADPGASNLDFSWQAQIV